MKPRKDNWRDWGQDWWGIIKIIVQIFKSWKIFCICSTMMKSSRWEQIPSWLMTIIFTFSSFSQDFPSSLIVNFFIQPFQHCLWSTSWNWWARAKNSISTIWHFSGRRIWLKMSAPWSWQLMLLISSTGKNLGSCLAKSYTLSLLVQRLKNTDSERETISKLPKKPEICWKMTKKLWITFLRWLSTITFVATNMRRNRLVKPLISDPRSAKRKPVLESMPIHLNSSRHIVRWQLI